MAATSTVKPASFRSGTPVQHEPGAFYRADRSDGRSRETMPEIMISCWTEKSIAGCCAAARIVVMEDEAIRGYDSDAR
jgi:hypothetical protein